MKEKIGNIIMNYDYYKGADLYSDGDIEDVILDIVKKEDAYRYTDERFSNWPVLYHLSRQRENIIEPLEISKTDEVLEIGAGMGAVTGAIAEKAKKVDCIELSKRRSLVNAYRHKDMDNIEIFVGNFQDIKIEKKYDVVTLIGVLEYAGFYIEDEKPFHAFLKQIKGCMKKDAKLYIAIENRLGMKYFAGYNEDHFGKPYVGIEGYLNEKKIRTFSYSEILKLLTECGFTNISFAFPFPDYKLPQAIYDEEAIMKYEVDFSERHNYDAPANESFNTLKAFKSLKGVEEIKYFANSFLIEAFGGES